MKSSNDSTPDRNNEELSELTALTGLRILAESAASGDEYAKRCLDEVCRKLKAATGEPEAMSRQPEGPGQRAEDITLQQLLDLPRNVIPQMGLREISRIDGELADLQQILLSHGDLAAARAAWNDLKDERDTLCSLLSERLIVGHVVEIGGLTAKLAENGELKISVAP